MPLSALLLRAIGCAYTRLAGSLHHVSRQPRQDLAPDSPGGPSGLSTGGGDVVATGPKRWSLLALGTIFTALGALGAILPILPTTPFLLLAAACFARSSPAIHRRLLSNRVFGHHIRRWQRERTVTRAAKLKGGALLVTTMALSLTLLSDPWLRWSLGAAGIVGLGILARLPGPADGDAIDHSSE